MGDIFDDIVDDENSPEIGCLMNLNREEIFENVYSSLSFVELNTDSDCLRQVEVLRKALRLHFA